MEKISKTNEVKVRRISFFYKTLKKNRKLPIITVTLIMAVFIVLLDSSYSYFKKRIEGTKLTFNVGTLNYELECVDLENCEVVIPANQSEVINLNLTSLNKIDTKYELYYEVLSPIDTENAIDGGHLKTENLSNVGEIEKNDSKDITIVLNNTGNDKITLKLGVAPSLKSDKVELKDTQFSLNKEAYQKYYVYDYNSEKLYYTFGIPVTGIYKIELWGAQGGGFTNYEGGKGGYVKGELYITKDTELYVYVGGSGIGVTEQHMHIAGGYNGGGNAMSELNSETGTVSTGGGATDIRLNKGIWSDFDSLKSRIMVAGGGGGSDYYLDKYGGYGGSGGGLIGYDGINYVDSVTEEGSVGTGGTQKKGGYSVAYIETNELNGGFGFGGSYVQENGSNSGAGGSGYYGGGSGHRYRAGGGGGSSFISGHNGCDAILESSTVSNIVHSSQSTHYSGYQFNNTVMIDGNGYNWSGEIGDYVGMPTYDATSTMIGNTGNGHAKITLIEKTDN